MNKNLYFFLKIRLSNGQLDNISNARRERVYSDCSNDQLDFNRTNPTYLSRYRNTCWFRCRTLSSSSSFDEYNSSNFNDKLSTSSAYARLKRFTERLLELERKARQPFFNNPCPQRISSKTAQTIEQTDRSFKKNDDHLFKSKIKLSRSQSYPQLIKNSTPHFPLRKIKTMSAINILPIESPSRPSTLLPFPIINQEKSNPIPPKEKQISFEVKTKSYNRQVQVKTKQEDTICTTKKPTSPTIITRIETRPPVSPNRVSIVHQQRRSSSRYFFFFSHFNENDFLF
jgi:hypothetical protein